MESQLPDGSECDAGVSAVWNVPQRKRKGFSDVLKVAGGRSNEINHEIYVLFLRSTTPAKPPSSRSHRKTEDTPPSKYLIHHGQSIDASWDRWMSGISVPPKSCGKTHISRYVSNASLAAISSFRSFGGGMGPSSDGGSYSFDQGDLSTHSQPT
jgi:hypothetical protein